MDGRGHPTNCLPKGKSTALNFIINLILGIYFDFLALSLKRKTLGMFPSDSLLGEFRDFGITAFLGDNLWSAFAIGLGFLGIPFVGGAIAGLIGASIGRRRHPSKERLFAILGGAILGFASCTVYY